MCVCVCVMVEYYSAIKESEILPFESESEVTQSCPTLWDPTEGSPPGSAVHEILQARVLEWVAIALSRFLSKINNAFNDPSSSTVISLQKNKINFEAGPSAFSYNLIIRCLHIKKFHF